MRLRVVAESFLVAMIALFGVILLTLTASIQAAVSLSAGTALVVPGTGTQNPQTSTNYMDNAVNYYIVPSCGTACPAGGYSPVPVPYIAQFWPFPFTGWGGLQGAKWDDSVQSGVVSLSLTYGGTMPTTDPVAVFGYSQGATVVSIFKRNLAVLNNGVIPAGTTFTLIGNPNRPNGGLFERLALLGTVPILDATFGKPTPTDTAPSGVTNTTDIVFQYDGIGDMASNILNVPAILNALAGFWYVHGGYLDPRGRPPNDAVSGELPYGYTQQDIEAIVAGCAANSAGADCQQHGDTIYVTIPARSLPILQPFIDLAAATGTSAVINPILALIQPLLQTVIEAGYDRQDYGKPTPFQLIPRVNPITFIGDLIRDIPEGINAAIATIKDPSHKIPDLPPLWGGGSSSATAVSATSAQAPIDTKAAPVAAEPTTRLVSKPTLVVPDAKSQDMTTTPGAVTSAEPMVRAGTQPVRDLTEAASTKLGPRRDGLQRVGTHAAPSRQTPSNAAKSAALANKPAA
jgi:hypothetical protein